MKFLLLLLLLVPGTWSQGPCLRASPSPADRIFCSHITGWDVEAVKEPVVTRATSLPLVRGVGLQTLSNTVPNLPTNMMECLSWECVCAFISGASWTGNACQMPGGTVMRKEIRKEYRAYTAAERDLYRQGFLAANVNNGIYRILSSIHARPNESPSAHSGPHFLPWHREFLKRLIIGIRTTSVNGNYPFASVSLPYWDSTRDDDIRLAIQQSPAYSVMFSNFLMGSVINGNLNDGQFAFFQGANGATRRQLDRWPGQLTLFKQNDVANVINGHTIVQILGHTTATSQTCRQSLANNAIEFIHGDVHVWIGGNMETITSSTNDPIFFMHHAFVDYIWEIWRQARQTRSQRETQWNTNTNCYSSHHAATGILRPFGSMTGLDGCSNQYTDNMFEYEAVPSCATNRPCSEFFYCRNTQCVARLRPQAPCRLVNGVDPCYQSICTRNVCRPPAGDAPRPSKPKPVPKADVKHVEWCYNLHECCASWAQRGECKNSPSSMRFACPASCGVCKPTSYKLSDSCANRHDKCDVLKKLGGCQRNRKFMAENCRQECGLCNKSRSQSCPAPSKIPLPRGYSPVKRPVHYDVIPPSYVPPTVCLNDHPCCEWWKGKGKCTSHKLMMDNVCRAACTCKAPHDLTGCTDFVTNCSTFKNQGLCSTSFMKENCRKTCRSCLTKKQQESQCSAM